MSPQYLTINLGDLIPLTGVKRVFIVDDDDRAWLAKKSKLIDPAKFNTKIEAAGGGKSFARQTLDELAQQGVSFVQITERAYVPASNIIKSHNLAELDFEQFLENTGRKLSEEFKSQVDTKAGNVLSIYSAEEIMDRLAHPYRPSPPGETATEELLPKI
jgi:hypothetical protein